MTEQLTLSHNKQPERAEDSNGHSTRRDEAGKQTQACRAAQPPEKRRFDPSQEPTAHLPQWLNQAAIPSADKDTEREKRACTPPMGTPNGVTALHSNQV